MPQESQPSENELKIIESRISQDFDDLVALPQTDEPVLIPTSETTAEKSPVHETPGKTEDHNAIESRDNERQPPERTVQPSSSRPPAAKMGSAEAIPSDTQVVSQSVYDEIIRKNQETGNDGLDSVPDRNTLITLQQGDSGHIDLLSNLDGAHIQASNTDENDDQSSSKLGESSPMAYEPNHFPESQRFLDKTPATTTKQHDEGVFSVSPLISRNPLASELESTSGIMALSQVFKATQAPSSPVVNGQQSDPMSDRPSPNIPIQHRPLAPNLSSPFNNIAATFPRDSSDTQLNYVTMKESQANRHDMIRERMTRSADHIYSDDQSDGEFNKEPSFVERQRRQRKIREEAAGQLALLSAPARQSSEAGDRAVSSPRAAERQESANGFTGSPQRHKPTSELQAVGTSEEETEQEEEIPKPIPRSQVPTSSTEEDKENCDDPSAASLSHTESAHGRLSQALSLHENPLATRDQPQNDQAADAITSSPISVVKDSQWSPGHAVEQAANGITESPSDRARGRLQGSQTQFKPTTRDGDGVLAPAKPAAIQYPIQESQSAPVALPSIRSDIADSVRSSAQSREGSTGPRTSIVRLKDTAGPDIAANENKAPLDFRGKSSSMPSRVAETPTHQRQSSSNELLPLGTIPETSPNRAQNDDWMSDGNNDAADQEDDDLPPQYPTASGPANHSQPVMSGNSTPNKILLNSKILSSPSGRQRRALTEIAADASPRVGGPAVDVNMDIMSAEDREFRSAVAMSPISSRKKRRSIHVRNIPASDPIVPVTPRARTLMSSREVVNEEPSDFVPQTSGPAFDANMEDLSTEEPEFRTVDAMSPTPSRKRRRYNDSRSVPASDPVPPGTPAAKPLLSPPRELAEEEVAVAPSPPLAESSIQQEKFSGRAKPSGRSRSIWDPEESPKFRVSSKELSQKFARSQARKRQIPSTSKAEPNEAPQSASVPARGPDAVLPATVSEGPSSAPAAKDGSDLTGQRPPQEQAVLAPNQVFALWKGRQRAYYPAVCFGEPFGTSQDQFLVNFEDSAPVHVQKGTVKRLELRLGDEVKVEMPNVPKVPHMIRGLADKLSADELSKGAVTDVYGHATLILEPKHRKSLQAIGQSRAENVINVPVAKIYLDMILWNRLKDRTFTYSAETGGSNERLQTPSDRHITPSSPSTRLSRSFRSSRMFSGMVFAVSFGDKSETKYRVTKMILENDGRILEDGFNELFDMPFNAPLATPTKTAAPQSTGVSGNLRLKTSAEAIGFVCLIADKHSRRPKYMQALALNLPCVSDRWIEDCVAKGQILGWEMYLLPAGESSYLNGATKSRILTPYPASKARISETVAARPNLLNGQSVLLITGRSGKADEERRKAYIFLTYALGASKIERVPDVESARAALHDKSQAGGGRSDWDWIYIDDDDKAAKAMAGNESASFSSKRRRKSRLTESISEDGLGLGANARIIGNEFVCQSLILGRLVGP